MSKSGSKGYHSKIVKQSIIINSELDKVWKKLSNVAGLPEWLINVKKTVYLSKSKRGIGTIRNITFADKTQIEEHVVAWNEKKSFSYLAITGLPLRIYFATITLDKKSPTSTMITWKTYLNSKNMTKKEFNEFVLFLTSFYKDSLKNLKLKLE